MKKVNVLILAILMMAGFSLTAQVAVTTNGSSADGSAMLDVQSSTKGFLPPRMTGVERNAISSPAAGLVIWCSNCGTNGELQVYNGTAWTNLTGGTASVAWTCGDAFTDSRDAQSYNTVQIDNQCWMAENLNVGTRIDGQSFQTNNSSLEKYCNDNDENQCNTYGGLYQWGEMVQYLNGGDDYNSWEPVPTGNVQGICPDGWHLPSDNEWTTLTTFLGGESVAGGKLKEAGTSHWVSPNTNATNVSGFTALGGGYFYPSSYYYPYYNFGTNGYWWTATENSSGYAYYRGMYYEDEAVYSSYGNKPLGHSVRCLKD